MDSPSLSTLRKVIIALLAIAAEAAATSSRMLRATFPSKRCMHSLPTAKRNRTMYRAAWHTSSLIPTSKFRQNTLHSLINLLPSYHLPNFGLNPLLSVRMMSSIAKQDIIPESIQSTLNDEEKSLYHELTLLSAKIRMLDEIYYGENNNYDGSMEVSDDEYDALARREAELCTLYPHLLLLLEEESGLGHMTTRYGGRVGKLIAKVEDDFPAGVNMNEVEIERLQTKLVVPSKLKRHKRQHLQNAPLQSLENAMNEADAVAWLNRVRKLLTDIEKTDTGGKTARDSVTAEKIPIQIMAEPKIDGLGLSLRFKLRKPELPGGNVYYDFVWGATRGDGTQGEDVTEAVQSAWMKENVTPNNSLHDYFTVPKSFAIPTLGVEVVDLPSILEIRGEVVLPQKAFDEFVEAASNTANSTSRTFSNARNAASGILLRSKEPTSQDEIERTKLLQSRLQFYAYDVVAAESEVNPYVWPLPIVGNSGIVMRDFLTNVGFRVPSPIVSETLDFSVDTELNSTDVPNLFNYHHRFMSIRNEIDTTKPTTEQQTFPYKIDGVVYKLASFHHRATCGSSSRTPRWAIAHKFPPLSAVTRLLDIEVQVGRTGALTPVAVLDPVDLGGAIVARASLHNFHFARTLLLPNSVVSGLPNPDGINDQGCGDFNVKKGISVLVSRAGDVIPQVMKRVFDNNDGEYEIDSAEHSNDIISLESPQKCPACGAPTSFEFIRVPPRKKRTRSKVADEDASLQFLSIDEKESSDAKSGQVLRCSGPQLLCQPRAMNALAYAYSRPGLDVKGLSKSKLNQLFEAGIIRFPSDLFTFFGAEDEGGEVLDRIADLPGWGKLSSRNLAESIRTVASEGVPLSRYIYSLGIPLIGTHASQLLAFTYGTVSSFLSALDEASLYDETNALKSEHSAEVPPLFPALVGGSGGSGKVKGIGPSAISALLSFSKEEVLMNAAKDLAKELTIHDDPSRKAVIDSGDEDGSHEKTKPMPLKDMTVVFTGTIPGMSRTLAKKVAKDLGARATPNTVSKATSLVVEGEDGGTKATKARELGIRVMDCAEFMKLME